MRTVMIGALLVIVIAPSRGRAWCPDKYPGQAKNAAYQTMPVKYRVSSNLTDPAILAAIDAAFTIWGGVQCSKLKFTKDAAFPITAPFTTATDGVSIYWVTAAANWPAGIDIKNFAYNYRFFDANANLTGGHVAVNATGNYAWNTTGGNATTFDVQNVLTNLIGKVIGLDDSNTPGSVMYNDVTFGQITKRTLSTDDQNAIKYTYPAGGSCAPAPGPDPTCGTTPPPPKDTGTTPGKESGTPPGKEAGTPPPGDYQVTPGKDGSGKACVTSAQCATDEVCVVEGYCKKIGGGGDGGGCGCEIGARSAPALGLALLALGMLVTLRRALRRRR